MITFPPTRVVTTPSTEIVEPITMVEAKSQCRVRHDEENDLLAFYIVTARRYAEKILGRKLITTTIQAWWEAFPSDRFIELPYPVLQSITHLKYTDSTGTVNTWTASNYFADILHEPGRLVLKDNISWPSATLYPANAIEIQYVVGYSTEPAEIPADIRAAILLMVGHLYANRENVVVGNSATAQSQLIAFGFQDLIANYRIF